MNLPPTVFLVDPDGPTRDTIEKLTNLIGLHCKAFASGQEFLTAFDPTEGGCIVMGIRVPGINGLQIQQRLRESGAPMPIIFITAGQACRLRSTRCGPGLAIPRKAGPRKRSLDAIHEAVQIDDQRRQVRLKQDEVNGPLRSLTEKEQAVLEMIADGLAKHVIATELGVSVRTVEHHRTQLMRKLQTNSLAGLMQFALSRRMANRSPAPAGPMKTMIAERNRSR